MKTQQEGDHLASASTGSSEPSVTTDTQRMDERTLTALRGSIEKWKAIEAGTGEDKFYHNCPLCQVFMNEYAPGTGMDDDETANSEGSCHGCPVKTKTGMSGCERSPWVEWNAEVGDVRKATTPELVALARAEREFLESLLPRATESGIGKPSVGGHGSDKQSASALRETPDE